MSKNNVFSMTKENFIKFISSATPEEINDFITKKGKPPKMIVPIIYYD